MDNTGNIRQCSYNPAANLIKVGRGDGQESEELYLEVKYREYWFQCYCQEHGISGVIDAGELIIDRYDDRFCTVKAVATVLMDGTPVSRMAASRFVSAGDSDGIQTTVTLAIGRALKEAGFGTVSAVTGEEGITCQADAGVALKKQPESEQKENTLPFTVEEKAAEILPAAPMTVKDAFNFIVPFGGYKGKTVSEVMAVDPERIEWFASESFNPDKGSGTENRELRKNFKAACRMVVDEANS